MTVPMLELVGLSRERDGRALVDRLSLRVDAGELLVLVGASGSGKTTTLKMINRLVEPTSGEVRLGGRRHDEEPPHLLRRRIGYVFQQVGLFPHLTVAENVAVRRRYWAGSARDPRPGRLAAGLVLSSRAVSASVCLRSSRREQQRVGIARAPPPPPLVLLDEPFGALEPLTREALQQASASCSASCGSPPSSSPTTSSMRCCSPTARRAARRQTAASGDPGRAAHGPPTPTSPG